MAVTNPPSGRQKMKNGSMSCSKEGEVLSVGTEVFAWYGGPCFSAYDEGPQETESGTIYVMRIEESRSFIAQIIPAEPS